MNITALIISSNAELLRRLFIKNIHGVSNVQFFFKDSMLTYDYIFVCHRSALKKIIPFYRAKRACIFFSMEPKEVEEKQDELYLQQFARVYISDSIEFKNQVNFNVSTSWLGLDVIFQDGEHIIKDNNTINFNTLNYDELPQKTRKISILSSSKKDTPGHRRRINFIDKLIESDLASHIDFFGYRGQKISDKQNALAQYEYSIIIENTPDDVYWSEKIMDALIMGSIPVYDGCHNMKKYIPRKSFIDISVDDYEKTERILNDIIINGNYDERKSALKQARWKMISEYNIFSIMMDAIGFLETEQNITRRTLLPKKYYTIRNMNSWLKKLKSL